MLRIAIKREHYERLRLRGNYLCNRAVQCYYKHGSEVLGRVLVECNVWGFDIEVQP